MPLLHYGSPRKDVIFTPLPPVFTQLVEELLTFWSLEDYEDQLEELEEALIVRGRAAGGRGQRRQRVGCHLVAAISNGGVAAVCNQQQANSLWGLSLC
jgi:hypothetical protein